MRARLLGSAAIGILISGCASAHQELGEARRGVAPVHDFDALVREAGADAKGGSARASEWFLAADRATAGDERDAVFTSLPGVGAW
ncbi:MAG TPA: hypothetical protein P5572_21080, partial [Phycisphaerae bacterium]|nr:hypothetical protein [Phycisphaerae bacterium]